MTWLERIVRAREQGAFTEQDVALAKCFTTCAISEHPHLYSEENVTHLLKAAVHADPIYQMGLEFYGNVVVGRVQAAEKIYHKIQDRALVLKRRWA